MRTLTSILWVITSVSVAETNIPDLSKELFAKSKWIMIVGDVKFEKYDQYKGLKKLENTFFEFQYPKCLNIEAGEDGDEGVKKAGSVLVENGSCAEGEKISDLFTVGITRDVTPNVEKASIAGEKLLNQNTTINGRSAKILASIFDSCTDQFGCPAVQLRRAVFIDCGKKTVQIISDIRPGKQSVEMIEKKEIFFSKNEQRIISSIGCRTDK